MVVVAGVVDGVVPLVGDFVRVGDEPFGVLTDELPCDEGPESRDGVVRLGVVRGGERIADLSRGEGQRRCVRPVERERRFGGALGFRGRLAMSISRPCQDGVQKRARSMAARRLGRLRA